MSLNFSVEIWLKRDQAKTVLIKKLSLLSALLMIIYDI
jgi:hypothetical protein